MSDNNTSHLRKVRPFPPNEKLEAFLKQRDIAWKVIPPPHHFALDDEWHAMYGEKWSFEIRQKHGLRAVEEYLRESTEAFFVVPFLRTGPCTHSKRSPTAAYECHGDGKVPDLSSFHATEFFIAPPGLSWTMIHTHEDYGLGGPFFIRNGSYRRRESESSRWKSAKSFDCCVTCISRR